MPYTGVVGLADYSGLYQLNAVGETSRCGFARPIFETARGGDDLAEKQVHPISTED